MNIQRFTTIVVVILVVELLAVSIIRSSIPYTTNEIVEINKLHEVGKQMCENNGGVSVVRFNTIFHHKVVCNDYTTITYTGKL